MDCAAAFSVSWAWENDAGPRHPIGLSLSGAGLRLRILALTFGIVLYYSITNPLNHCYTHPQGLIIQDWPLYTTESP